MSILLIDTHYTFLKKKFLQRNATIMGQTDIIRTSCDGQPTSRGCPQVQFTNDYRPVANVIKDVSMLPGICRWHFPTMCSRPIVPINVT